MFPFGLFAGALIFGSMARGFYNALSEDEARRKRNRMLAEEKALLEQKAQREAQARRNALGRFLTSGSTAYDEVDMDLSNTLRNYELQYKRNKQDYNLFNGFTSGVVNGLNMYNRFQGMYDGRFKNQKN